VDSISHLGAPRDDDRSGARAARRMMHLLGLDESTSADAKVTCLWRPLRGTRASRRSTGSVSADPCRQNCVTYLSNPGQTP
jgi:hypothetical protein